VFPQPGDVVVVSRDASVQFAEPFLFRVTRVYGWPTYDHWCWLGGYVLDRQGEAVARRDLFVQPAGLRRWHPPRRSRGNRGRF
jgi:hypothetical protein